MALPMNANIKLLNLDAVRLDRFDGTNYMRWKDKMTFLLTTLKVSYILDPKLQPIQASKENDSEAVKNGRLKCEEDELICHLVSSPVKLAVAVLSSRFFRRAPCSPLRTGAVGTLHCSLLILAFWYNLQPVLSKSRFIS
ncbi:hypothetical protein SLEP1_g43520 [Rubroshorea leprosula]|uniref:Retrotransposon Copia-like N-terminal domain-containing protein n=1 Tax=Rubroshorea leprosula TaxID=152421 RepID=A0AAV5LD90_9ROSI|nr:hypothetical protein SLEP1_g43520 [Rubroshorea leprosula]